MRILKTITVLFLAALMAAGAASAQARINKQMRINPSVNRQVMTPNITIIPPSMAIARALAIHPTAKPLSVKRAGNGYKVKLVDGDKILNVTIPGQ